LQGGTNPLEFSLVALSKLLKPLQKVRPNNAGYNGALSVIRIVIQRPRIKRISTTTRIFTVSKTHLLPVTDRHVFLVNLPVPRDTISDFKGPTPRLDTVHVPFCLRERSASFTSMQCFQQVLKQHRTLTLVRQGTCAYRLRHNGRMTRRNADSKRWVTVRPAGGTSE